MSVLSRTAGLAGWDAGSRLLPGLVLSAGLGWLALRLAEHAWVQAAGLSGLSLAIVLGMVVGNLGYARIAVHAEPGVVFSKQNLLRLGIVLYGLRLTVQDVAQVGAAGVLIGIARIVLSPGESLGCRSVAGCGAVFHRPRDPGGRRLFTGLDPMDRGSATGETRRP